MISDTTIDAASWLKSYYTEPRPTIFDEWIAARTLDVNGSGRIKKEKFKTEIRIEKFKR